MNSSHNILILPVIILLITPVAAGPLVDIVEFTPRGGADLEIDSVPDVASLTQVNESVVRFEIPAAVVSASNVSRTPSLTYKVWVPGLQYHAVGVRTIKENQEQVSIEIPSQEFRSEIVDRSEYSGYLTIEVHSGKRIQTFYEGNITVEVRK